MGFTPDQLLSFLNSEEEMQGVFFIALCCLGFWVIFSWLIQIIRAILWIWPLLLVVALLIAVPPLRVALTEEIIPKRVNDIMQRVETSYYNHFNNQTDLYWF